MSKPPLKSKSAAEKIGVSERSLSRLRKNGEIKAYLLRENAKRPTWLYPEEELDKYMTRKMLKML